MSALTGWTELDDRAVAYARALSADAVQKVGNGHPGTAMSLAPVAYLLFQRHPNKLNYHVANLCLYNCLHPILR